MVEAKKHPESTKGKKTVPAGTGAVNAFRVKRPVKYGVEAHVRDKRNKEHTGMGDREETEVSGAYPSSGDNHSDTPL